MNPFAVLDISDDEEEKITVPYPDKKGKLHKAPIKKMIPGAPASAAAKNAKMVHNEVMPPSTVENRSSRRKDGKKQKDEGGRPKKHDGMDRQSGSGRDKGVSKGGSGKSNWGNEDDEARQAEKNPPLDDDVAGFQESEVDADPIMEPEPVAPTFTLDEYMARRENSRVNTTVFGTVSERTAASDFSGMKAKEEEKKAFIVLGTGKEKKSKSTQRSDGKSVILDLGFKACPQQSENDSHRGGRLGRGEGKGRGGGRGGRGDRIAGRGSRSGGKIDILDTSAFPSL